MTEQQAGEAEDAAFREYHRALSAAEDWYDAEVAKLRSAYEAKIEAADEVCQVAIRAARREAA